MKRFVLAAASVLLCAGFAQAQTYKVDPVHSSIIFSAKHFGATNVYGRFTKVAGTVDYGNSIEATVTASSVDTNNEKRDNHLRGTDFLSANQFPNITFKSTNWTKATDNTWEVVGNLTLHGVTKEITITLEQTGEGKLPNGTPIVGFETHFTINRSEYNINALPGVVGEQINLIVSLECDKE